MSIESYDVEPVDHRVLFTWLLGAAAVCSGVLALIGWPLPVFPGRYVHTDSWNRTVELIEAWWGHDGWRMSGASWFWGGLAVGTATGGIVVRIPARGSWTRRWLVILLPGGVLAGLGPVVQSALGLSWSNYSAVHDRGATVAVYVVGLVVVVGLPFLRGWIDRGRGRTGDPSTTRR